MRAADAARRTMITGGVMSVIGSFFTHIGTWFGYVGSCVVGPDPTCRPFLGFVLLAALAVGAFVLLVMAYRSLNTEDTRDKAEREARLREREMREHVRRTLQANTVRGSGGRRSWHVPA
jgi:hypothetical protein